jgi:hypothetical protein
LDSEKAASANVSDWIFALESYGLPLRALSLEVGGWQKCSPKGPEKASMLSTLIVRVEAS